MSVPVRPRPHGDGAAAGLLVGGEEEAEDDAERRRRSAVVEVELAHRQACARKLPPRHGPAALDQRGGARRRRGLLFACEADQPRPPTSRACVSPAAESWTESAKLTGPGKGGDELDVMLGGSLSGGCVRRKLRSETG